METERKRWGRGRKEKGREGRREESRQAGIKEMPDFQIRSRQHRENWTSEG